jgi:hypothetical protein
MGILAAIGAAAWPVLRALVPWAGPKTIMVLIAAVALLASHGGVAGYVWVKGYQARAEAIAERDQHWITELQKAKAAHENRIADALDAARTTPALPDTAAGLDELCRKSKTCRDNHRRGK